MSNVSKDDPEKPMTVKLVILGKSLVGKSALTYRYICDKFPNEHDTTVEDQYKVNMTIEGIKCEVEILDTAGQDDYQTMLDTWINSADGFILVYSIDNKESFESTKTRYDRIIKLKEGQKVSIVVVGNKCDLADKRKVSREEVDSYCKSHHINFLEASALNTINVKETFLLVARGLLQINFPEKYSNKGSAGGNKKRCYCF